MRSKLTIGRWSARRWPRTLHTPSDAKKKMAQKATAGALINVANTAADAEGGNGQAAKMRDGENGDESSDDAAQDGSHANESSAEQRRGHGRNGAGAFANATHIVHALFVGIIGSICQACGIGRMSRYRQKLIVVIKGQPLFDAQTHHFEQARCKLCGAIVRADGTEAITQSGLGSSYITYDFSACAMLLVMHYFAGVPFKRLESLQAGWGIPMPDANQWSLADASADLLFPLYKALERHGVQNALALRIDDTGSMVIEVRSEIRKEVAALEALGESSKHVRTGINATGVYLDTEQGKVLLFFTGRHHAGEIIDQILQHRQARQSKLVKVSDAASKTSVTVTKMSCKKRSATRTHTSNFAPSKMSIPRPTAFAGKSIRRSSLTTTSPKPMA
jgi:transposase